MNSRNRPSRPGRAAEQLISALLPDIAGRRPAPPPVSVAALPAPGTSSVEVKVSDIVLLGIARIDPSGRFHERALLRALGWNPGRWPDIDTTRDRIVIVPATGGAHRVTEHGAIALPAAARWLCSLPPRRPVVLVADACHQRLVVHPAAAVIQLLTEHDSDRHR